MLRRHTALLSLVLACGGSASERPPGSGEPSPPVAAGAPPADEVTGAALPVPATPAAGTQPAASTHCVDLAAADPCADDGGWRDPTPIVRASELGAGFAFVSLNDRVAFANGLPHPKAVVLEPEGTQVIELDDADDKASPMLMLDAWHSSRFETSRLVALACSSIPGELGQPLCALYSAERDADTGRFGRLSLWEFLDPPWGARGLVDLWGHTTERWEFCVYGRGIHCRHVDGSWADAVVPEQGRIVDVDGGLALTESGTLLAPRGSDLFDWQEVPTSAPLTRLAEAGAFNDEGLWVTRVAGRFEECHQRPLLLAGNGTTDWLDGGGTPYWMQAQPTDYRYELCRRPSALPGAVLGEAYLGCGISRNWVVLTSEAAVAMAGSLVCAFD